MSGTKGRRRRNPAFINSPDQKLIALAASRGAFWGLWLISCDMLSQHPRRQPHLVRNWYTYSVHISTTSTVYQQDLPSLTTMLSRIPQSRFLSLKSLSSISTRRSLCTSHPRLNNNNPNPNDNASSSSFKEGVSFRSFSLFMSTAIETNCHRLPGIKPLQAHSPRSSWVPSSPTRSSIGPG